MDFLNTLFTYAEKDIRMFQWNFGAIGSAIVEFWRW